MSFLAGLARGKTLVGTVVSLPDLALAEAAADSFDFVWVDLEHSSLDLREAEALAIVCQGRGCSTLVRVTGTESEHLRAILDAGVDGLVAPMVETAAEAQAFAERLAYPPGGVRGYGPRRASAHGRIARFWESEAARSACVLQIETPTAVANAREIAAVEGVDALVVGCADLSLTMGLAGEQSGPEMTQALEAVAAAADEAGVFFGIAAGGSPADVADRGGGSAAFLVYSVDARLYVSALDAAAAGVAGAASQAGMSLSDRLGPRVG